MSIYKRLMSVDHRIIYIILAVAIIFPFYKPVGFPVALEAPAKAMYDYVDGMAPGSVIAFGAHYSASSLTEIRPMVEIMVDLAIQKQLKIVIFNCQWAEGGSLFRTWSTPIFEKYNYVYGTDYINLGYQPLASAFLEASRTDLKGAANGGVDYAGARLDSFPIMANINTASDFDCVVTFDSGDPGYTIIVAQWGATSEVKAILTGIVAVSVPGALNSYGAGNLKGVAGGLNGAATLEKLHGVVGSAHGNSDAQSFGHMTIILFLIVGNIGYFGAKRAGEVK